MSPKKHNTVNFVTFGEHCVNIKNQSYSCKPINEKEQVQFLKEATEESFADSQYNYGLLWEDGIGVPKDIRKAFEWYKKSAKQGYPAAKKKLESFCGTYPKVCE